MSNYLYLVITCVIGSQVSHYITKEEDVMWFELPELLPNPVAVVLKSASTQKWGDIGVHQQFIWYFKHNIRYCIPCW